VTGWTLDPKGLHLPLTDGCGIGWVRTGAVGREMRPPDLLGHLEHVGVAPAPSGRCGGGADPSRVGACATSTAKRSSTIMPRASRPSATSLRPSPRWRLDPPSSPNIPPYSHHLRPRPITSTSAPRSPRPALPAPLPTRRRPSAHWQQARQAQGAPANRRTCWSRLVSAGDPMALERSDRSPPWASTGGGPKRSRRRAERGSAPGVEEYNRRAAAAAAPGRGAPALHQPAVFGLRGAGAPVLVRAAPRSAHRAGCSWGPGPPRRGGDPPARLAQATGQRVGGLGSHAAARPRAWERGAHGNRPAWGSPGSSCCPPRGGRLPRLAEPSSSRWKPRECQSVRLPVAESASSAASSPVRFDTSKMGLTSTRSSALSLPVSATSSSARCASR